MQHLLEDLREAYPGALEETISTEVAANSLDSGAIATEDDVQLYDVVLVAQAGFATNATSFTEYTHQP